MLHPRLDIKQDRNSGRLVVTDLTGSFDPVANTGGYGEINTTAGQATAELTLYRATDGAYACGPFRFSPPVPCAPQTLASGNLSDGVYLFDYQVFSRFGVPAQKCSYRVEDIDFPNGSKLLIGIIDTDNAIAWVDKTSEVVVVEAETISWSAYMTTTKYSLWRVVDEEDALVSEGDLIQFDCFRSALDNEERELPELVGASLTAHVVDHQIRRKIARIALRLGVCCDSPAADVSRRLDKWAHLYYQYNELLALAGGLPPTAVMHRINKLHQLADRIC